MDTYTFREFVRIKFTITKVDSNQKNLRFNLFLNFKRKMQKTSKKPAKELGWEKVE